MWFVAIDGSDGEPDLGLVGSALDAETAKPQTIVADGEAVAPTADLIDYSVVLSRVWDLLERVLLQLALYAQATRDKRGANDYSTG
jgi:hypothetical protein